MSDCGSLFKPWARRIHVYVVHMLISFDLLVLIGGLGRFFLFGAVVQMLS
jgi:hypothetical protein